MTGVGGWPKRRGACTECGRWKPLHEHGVHRLCRRCLDKAEEREEDE